MRRIIRLVGVLAVVLSLVLAAHVAWPYPDFARSTKAACAGCHVNPAGGKGLTAEGTAFKSDSTKVPAAGTPTEYVGVNKCRMCHSKQHKAWSETKHAKAFEKLKAADPKAAAEVATRLKIELKGAPAENAACVKCHVTGFQLAGGYPAADSTKSAALVNVTCEACHGPGAKHVSAPVADKKKFINRAVGASLCMRCHTPEMSPKFNFEEYKARGVHTVKTGS